MIHCILFATFFRLKTNVESEEVHKTSAYQFKAYHVLTKQNEVAHDIINKNGMPVQW